MKDFFENSPPLSSKQLEEFTQKYPVIKGHEKEFSELIVMLQIEVFDKIQRRLDYEKYFEKNQLRQIRRVHKQQIENKKNGIENTDNLIIKSELQKEIITMEANSPVSNRGNRKQDLPVFIANALKDFWLHELNYEFFRYDKNSGDNDAKPFCLDIIKYFLNGEKIIGN